MKYRMGSSIFKSTRERLDMGGGGNSRHQRRQWEEAIAVLEKMKLEDVWFEFFGCAMEVE